MKTIQFDFDNVPGITAVYAIPLTSFVGIAYNPIFYHEAYPLLIRTEEIVQIPVFADSSFSFTEKQSREDGGELWAVEITGMIPKMHPLNDATIRTLERGDWLVMHRDANGSVQLSGTKDVPLHFLSNKSSGQSSTNGNSFLFSGSEPEPSLFIHIPVALE